MPSIEFDPAVPADMRDYYLVPWKTTGDMLNVDPEKARAILRGAGVPLVKVSERRVLPRWGTLRDFIKQREAA